MLETRLTIGLKEQGRHLSSEAFRSAEFEEPYRYERMGGRLVVMTPSGLAHNRIVFAVMMALFAYDAAHPGTVELILQEAWVGTSEANDRLADVAVYLAADGPQSPVQRERVPALVFEVISDGSEERDYVIKRREYFDAGVREYVIADPFRKVLTVLVRADAEATDQELGPEQTFRSRQLPGFELRVAALGF